MAGNGYSLKASHVPMGDGRLAHRALRASRADVGSESPEGLSGRLTYAVTSIGAARP